MKIGVIGGGSVGLLMSIYLSHKHEITIYVKREIQKKKINKEGLFLVGSQNNNFVKARLLNEMKREDLIIICVKQPHLINIIEFLRSKDQSVPLLFLQNGMTHLQQLKDLINPIYLGVVEHGALRKEDNKLLHTGKGIVSVSAYNISGYKLDMMTNQLNSPSFPVHKSKNFKQLLKEKLMINAVINPLTAILNTKNGSIVSNSSVLYLAKKICTEVAQTLELDPRVQWLRIKRVVQRTSANYSSMLMDIIKSQETEIETILGYVLKISKEELPYTSFAYYSVKAIEANKEKVK